MKLPYIPITLPEKQMDSVTQFCHAWAGPVIVELDGEQVIMMPYDYYKENLCTPEESFGVEQQLRSVKDDTNPG